MEVAESVPVSEITAATAEMSLSSRQYANPMDYGATGGGVLPDDAAIMAALAACPRLLLPGDRKFRTSTSFTIPNGADIYVDDGATNPGMLLPDAGTQILIRGEIVDAPWKQIFGGAGSVVGLTYNHTSWWGAKHDFGVTSPNEDGAPINRACRSAEASYGSDGGRPTVDNEWAGNSYIGTPVYLTPNGLPIKWQSGYTSGYGRLYTNVRSKVPTFHIRPSAYPLSISGFEIDGLHVSPFDGDYHDTLGLKIGDDANQLGLTGTLKNEIRHVDCSGCEGDIHLVDCNEMNFENCSAMNTAANWRGTGLRITSHYFDVSELDFTNLKLACPAASLNSGVPQGCNIWYEVLGSHGISGVRFNSGQIYGGQWSVYGHITSGSLSQIWHRPGLQFDGPIGTCFDLDVSGSGDLGSIHINPQYINECTQHAIQIIVHDGGIARDMDTEGNRYYNVNWCCVWAEGVTGICMDGSVQLECGYTPSGTPIIATYYLKNCTDARCSMTAGAKVTATGYSHIAYVTGASTARLRLVGNSGPASTGPIGIDASTYALTANDWVDHNVAT